MNKQRFEWRVGLFILVGLVLAAALILRFSKGAGPLSRTYEISLTAANVGGIIPGAAILMAGVPIGTIDQIDLSPSGNAVTMHAQIIGRYKIAANAIFSIRQAGFLGDRFIAVSPGPPLAPGEKLKVLQPGASVACQEPFDLAEVAESANTLMQRMANTVAQLNQAVTRLDTTLLSPATLGNITQSVANVRTLSERAIQTVDRIDNILATNTPPLNTSVSNISAFSSKLNEVAVDLQSTLASNRVELTSAMQNLNEASGRVNHLLADVEAGKGLAGSLLKNQEMALYTSETLSNVMVLSSNINNRGLWSVIRKPKTPKE